MFGNSRIIFRNSDTPQGKNLMSLTLEKLAGIEHVGMSSTTWKHDARVVNGKSLVSCYPTAGPFCMRSRVHLMPHKDNGQDSNLPSASQPHFTGFKSQHCTWRNFINSWRESFIYATYNREAKPFFISKNPDVDSKFYSIISLRK